MQRITPFLWYDKEAEEAAKFCCSVFKKSKILKTTRYGDAGPGPKGSVMTVQFQLDGQEFIALNGGTQFEFTEALSLSVACKDQKMLGDEDPKKAKRVMEAMLNMKKIDLRKLEQAYKG